MHYADFQFLTFDKKPNGVVVMTLNRPEVMNATNARLHWELTQIWPVLDADESVRVVVVTGAGERAFSAGGDLEWISEMVGNASKVQTVLREAGDIVLNMLACEKPIISAINGVAVGAGLAVAMMADISIMAEEARLTDGHVRLGVSAGDHAVILWPLLCGMAKAKYYLMTADFLDGKEAERIGLVSPLRPARAVDGEGARNSRQARERRADGDPLHQALAQQLVADLSAGVRRVARARNAVLPRRRREGGRGGAKRRKESRDSPAHDKPELPSPRRCGSKNRIAIFRGGAHRRCNEAHE